MRLVRMPPGVATTRCVCLHSAQLSPRQHHVYRVSCSTQPQVRVVFEVNDGKHGSIHPQACTQASPHPAPEPNSQLIMARRRALQSLLTAFLGLSAAPSQAAAEVGRHALSAKPCYLSPYLNLQNVLVQ